MKEVTVIGAGTAGLTFIEKLRQADPACKITLIDKNKYHFSRNDTVAFAGDISRRIDLAEWSLKLGFEFIQGQLERINPRRKKIFLKEMEPRDFDKVIIATGLSSKKMPVKGEHREGFFYLSQIDPIKLKDLLRICAEATVYVSTWLGIKLIFSLISLGKELTLVAANLDFLGSYKDKIMQSLAEKKVNFYLDAALEEAVGEGMIKAVKISPLKVFSAQLLFIDSGFVPNFDFSEENLAIKNTFFSDYPGLYFLGDVSRKNLDQERFFLYHQEEARKQAGMLCDFLLNGKEVIFKEKLSDNSLCEATMEKFLSEANPALS